MENVFAPESLARDLEMQSVRPEPLGVPMPSENDAEWIKNLDKMRQDNQQWRDEHARWHAEIQVWQKEANRLTAVLFRLERAVPEYGDTLKHHAFSILQHDLRLRHHEKKLASTLHNGPPREITREILQTEHREQADHHRQVRQEHEEMRRIHQEAILEIRRLTGLADEIAHQIPDGAS